MMKPHPRIFLLILMMLPIVLTSCGSKPAQEQVVITLMHGWGWATPDHVAMRQIYKDFELANPDVKIIFDSSPNLNVVIEKANDMLAADKMPDIISTNGSSQFLNNALIKRYALDLKPYIDADEEFRNSIHPSTLDVWMKDNQIYTLPDALEVIGYWYNEDIMRQAGITVDSTPDSAIKIPTTWDEFWETCNRIQGWAEANNKDVIPLMMEKEQNTAFLGARIAGDSSNGYKLINDSIDFQSQEFRHAIDDLRKAQSYSNDTKINISDARQMFLDKKTVFYFNGVWESADFSMSSIKDHIKSAVFPGYDQHTISYISPSSGYVIGNTGDPRKIEACVRFLKYMLSEEVQKRMVQETKQVPSNPNVSLSWIKETTGLLGQALETAYQADIQIRTLESSGNKILLDAMQNNVERAIKNEITTDELIQILSKNQ